MTDIAQNLATVKELMDKAGQNSPAKAAHIDLVAVSKTWPGDHIRPALAAGQRVFGENKVQEAEDKWPALRAEYPDIQLHLIGPLQSNKVNKAVQLFDVIETLDRPKLAAKIKHAMDQSGKSPRLYVQVNTGKELQKAGILPDDLPGFLDHCRQELGLAIEGLMCIPPANEEPAMHFAFLHKLARDNDIEKLSMGMSGDYETAIATGATSVRVGSAIFGARDYGPAA